MPEQVVTEVRALSWDDAGGDAHFLDALTEMLGQAARQPDGVAADRLRALTRHIPVNVWAVDADGRFTLMIGNAPDRVGMTQQEIVGAHISRFGELAEAELGRAMAGEPSALLVEGSTGGRSWTYKTFLVPLGPGAGAAALSIDITDQHLVQRHAAEAARNEARFGLLAEHAPIGIFIVGDHSEIVYANPRLRDLLQRSDEEVRGRPWLSFVHPDDLASAVVFDEEQENAQQAASFECRAVRADGTARWLRIRVAHRIHDDELGPITVGTAADVTDTIEAAEAVRESNDRTRAIIESAAEGIVTADEAMRIVEFNAAAERIFGYDSSEAIGMPVAALVADDHRALVERYFTDVGSDQPMGLRPREIHGRRRDGVVVPVELRVTAVQTASGRLYIGMVHDLSERKSFLRQLEHQATHDPLTGLPNKVMLMAQLEAALARARRLHQPVAVLFVGLDRIKLVTSSLGHAAGDRLVLEAAQRLAQLGRESGAVVTRFAGDQFVLVAEEVDDVGDAVDLAVEAVAVLQQPFVIGEEEAFVSADVGIALAPAGVGSAETLVANADVAYFRAKNRADQHYEVFDAEMRSWIESRRKLEVALRYGIERREFTLHYQPIVELSTGVVRGAEALARWNHPMLGLLPPGEFIPLSEDSGLIVPLGEQLLEAACERLAAWQAERPDVFVSCNLSAQQLGLPDLVATVRRALEDAGAEPSGLHLEITETMLLRDVDAAEQTLHALKDVGVTLCLDDFGTGYSSLSYLGRFPIDTIKIDRSFVTGVVNTERDHSIVAMIVGMAGALDLDVVAEGVETTEQLVALREMGCGLAQGYLFARPCHWDDLGQAREQVEVPG